MGNLLRLLGRRLISLPFVAFGVVFLVFFLMSFSQYDPAVSALGENATAEQLAAYRHEMGFDRSWGEQFLSYLGGLFQGNLGVYGVNKDSVSSRIATAFPITLQLPFMDLLFGVHPGVLGETCGIAILLGFAWLLVTRTVTFTIPGVYVGTVIVCSLFTGHDVATQVFSGGLLLCAVFMATDYTTSPTTFKGQVIFAVGLGLIT